MTWKYESADATPTIIVVADTIRARQWLQENNLTGSWRGYFNLSRDAPNWPINPGILTLDVPGTDPSPPMAFPVYDDAQTWLNDNVDGTTNFTVTWVPPSAG